MRTTEVTPDVLAFAANLEAMSGYPAVLVVDARHSIPPCATYPIIALSKSVCNSLGLYCPDNFAWKCGDYGYYLARRQFPETRHFWMIETDVRFYGAESNLFFRFFEDYGDVDFLSTHIGPADPYWFWAPMTRARDVRPFRCLFPVTRLSARAIDTVLTRRIEHSRRVPRRLMWPNDEALVATTLLNGDFVCRDLNDFGRAFYGDDTFYFGSPINGDSFEPAFSDIQLVHPILFGSSYTAKIAKLHQKAQQERPDPWHVRKWQTAIAKLNALSRW